MRGMLRALTLAAGLAFAAPVAAQDAPPAATLIADQIRVDGLNRLVADGHVEIFYDGYRVQAGSITYDQDTDQLLIEGEIRLTSPSGTVLTAEAAELSADLTNGILRSARLVLDQQLQLAAAQIDRIDGRYSVLSKTVASSCRVCAGQVPLWRIRAERIIHDEDAQQLFFDHARFEVAGVPIVYLPRLRLPDPTLERSSGFLIPDLRVSNTLGTGLKVPYFFTLGDHADLTLSPYYSTRTNTLEARYRQAFRFGEIELNGAISRDDLRPGETRYYLFSEGEFDLPRDFTLRFKTRSVSDPAYLLDYGYSDADRLTSSVSVGRTRKDEYINAEILHFNSLRASENNATLPTLLTNVEYKHRFAPATIGGVAQTKVQVFSFERRSNADVVGRDVARLSAEGKWRRNWQTGNGVLISALGQVNFDYYATSDDTTTPSPETRIAPFGAVELRWPLVKGGANGVSHVLEPVAQLVWSDTDTSAINNEDSLSVEFDEGNLFSLSRFAGQDAYEQGLRANIGATWTRYDPDGWYLAVAGGRVYRADNQNQFPDGTGLNGRLSDWLLAVQFATAQNLSLINRAVFDDGLDFTRNELRLDWTHDALDISSSFIWQEANLTENRPADSSEWVMDLAYDVTPNWTAKADWRYDFLTDDASEAGIGLEYRNECVSLDLSLSRRFTSSTNVDPSTDFGLTISLAGFGATGDTTRYRRSCLR